MAKIYIHSNIPDREILVEAVKVKILDELELT